MDAKELNLIAEVEGDLDNAKEVQYSECRAWTPLCDWYESEVYCEDCGSHPALSCPACNYTRDLVFSIPVFKVR